MITGKKRLLLTVIIIIIAGVGILTKITMDPISVLSNKLQLDLSDSAKVLHYDYNIITGCPLQKLHPRKISVPNKLL